MSKTVNLGAPYVHRITLRLTEEQQQFLIRISGMLGVSPSDYLRMSINTAMVGMKKYDDRLEEAYGAILGKEEVGMSDENVKADSNDIV